jgi:methyl-accepting chemotaxis protein
MERDAAPYFLTDVALRHALPLIEVQSQLRGLGAGILQTDASDFSERAAVQSRLDSIAHNRAAVLDALDAAKRAGENTSEAWGKAQDASIAFATAAKGALMVDLMTMPPATYFAQASTAVESAWAFENATMTRLSELLDARKNRLERGFLLLAITVAVLFVSLNYLLFGFYQSFMRAMLGMHKVLGRTAGGDLSSTYTPEGRDELADTGRSLESMTGNLSSLVANIRSNATVVALSAQALLEGTSELSSRTEQQASSLEETSASVIEMTDTVKKNAESAQNADRLASSLRKIGESSGSAMAAAVKSMEGIQGSAARVQEMVSLIDGIAFQTNILALNAAVEAARAGEQGRGFAVVAAEVRNLAQRSAAAAKEIKTLIDASAQQVDNGVAQIGEVSGMMAQIVKGIHDVAANIHTISAASAEQSSGLVQISAALQHLDEITQSNGAMAEQARQSSEAMELRAMALTKAVASFRLRQGTAEEALALVHKAVAFYRQHGKASLKLITENTDKTYADRDMYVFAFDRQGKYHAAAGLPARVGVLLKDLPGLDGAKLVRDAFAQAGETGGWVDYSIVNPVTKNIEMKTSFVVSVEKDLVLGCGVYKIA